MSEIQLTGNFAKVATIDKDEEDNLVFPHPGSFSRFNMRANRKVFNDLLTQLQESKKDVEHLKLMLKEHSIHIIPREVISNSKIGELRVVVENTSAEFLEEFLEERKTLIGSNPVRIEYRDLTYWTKLPKKNKIETVGSTLHDIIFGVGEKSKVILSMVLLVGYNQER